MGKIKHTYRPYVTYSALKAAIPFDWKSHGCIGIATNDHATAERWRAAAYEAGYTTVREAAQFRAMCRDQWQRTRDKLHTTQARRSRARDGAR